MTNAIEVKNFLDSITAMVSKTNEEIVSVSAHVADIKNGVDREITYSVQDGTRDASSLNVSAKDIYDRLWKCRDFEISLVWIRATFMTAFLLGCFVAYGKIASGLWNENVFNWDSGIHGFCACIAAIGATMSLMWIALAKGSKAWYETYEYAIRAFGEDYGYSNNDPSWQHVVGANWWCIKGFPFSELKYNQNPLAMRAGAFSVSKINIGIGIVFLVVWLVLMIAHLSCEFRFLICLRSFGGVFAGILSILLLIGGCALYFKGVGSGVLCKLKSYETPDCKNCRNQCNHKRI